MNKPEKKQQLHRIGEIAKKARTCKIKPVDPRIRKPEDCDALDYYELLLCVAEERINKFVIDDNNRDVIQALCTYFSGCEGRLDLNKGIYLSGSVGSGKSFLMECIREVNGQFSQTCGGIRCNSFAMAGAIEISQQYQKEGLDGNEKFVLQQENSAGKIVKKPGSIYIDDLGNEPRSVSHFGSTIEPLKLFLLHRAEYFTRRNVLTHVTSNYKIDRLGEFYGPKVMDRARQMFNVLELKGGSRRK